MKSALRLLTWTPVVGVILYAIWHPNGYALLAAWIVILGLYLSNAFDRIEKLEKRKREPERTASVSSTEPEADEQSTPLHIRIVEALALAIEAKDDTTHRRLQRVRTYAVEIGRELSLGEEEIEALNVATLLFDIGKLGVPEQIINKPGRLTPEEFEKMKEHTTIGSEILDRIGFPYPLVPIVRSHHERWDGTGYPDGLSGECIPIGARILAAVDSLDALNSGSPSIAPLPLSEAMAKVKEMAGSWFDPKVVEILERRYKELEYIPPIREAENVGFMTSIASARQESQTMFELNQDLGVSLSLSETLSVLSMRLRRMIPFDSIAVFVNRNGWLLPELVSGENFRALSSLKIRVGEGLCGRVAENSTPIVNGNPQVEAEYSADCVKHTTSLKSALVVPLEGLNGVVGVLAMYQTNRDAFTPDHLRILLAVASKVALSVENALKYQQAGGKLR